MSDFLNIKDVDVGGQGAPIPENGYPGQLSNHRQMMNTMNVELSDQQTKFLMMQTEIDRSRDLSQNFQDKSSKTFVSPLVENRVGSIY